MIIFEEINRKVHAAQLYQSANRFYCQTSKFSLDEIQCLTLDLEENSINGHNRTQFIIDVVKCESPEGFGISVMEWRIMRYQGISSEEQKLLRNLAVTHRAGKIIKH